MLNSEHSHSQCQLRIRLPRFLTLHRKYEVDETNWLVKVGRSRLPVYLKIGRTALTYCQSAGVALALQVRKLGSLRHTVGPALVRLGRKPVLLLQWGRIPNEWELSFVASMKSAEAKGVSFTEVLQTDLPLVLGEVPSDVLMRWVGKRARSQPKRFVKSINEMFGRSGKKIIIGLQDVLDPEKMIVDQTPREEKFQSLIDAIQQADATNSAPLKYLDKDRWKNFKGE